MEEHTSQTNIYCTRNKYSLTLIFGLHETFKHEKQLSIGCIVVEVLPRQNPQQHESNLLVDETKWLRWDKFNVGLYGTITKLVPNTVDRQVEVVYDRRWDAHMKF